MLFFSFRHVHPDLPVVQELEKRLRQRGVQVYTLLEHPLVPGDDFEQAIQAGIAVSQGIVTFWSPRVLERPAWVTYERATAMGQRKPECLIAFPGMTDEQLPEDWPRLWNLPSIPSKAYVRLRGVRFPLTVLNLLQVTFEEDFGSVVDAVERFAKERASH